MKRFFFTLSCFLMVGALHLSAQTVEITVDNIKYSCSDGEATVTGYVSKPSGKLELPNTVTHNETSYTVTSIGNDAFLLCSRLTEINFPASLTSIGNVAFGDCHALTEVNFPASLTLIGQNLFVYCENLTAINVNSANSHFKSIDGVLFSKDETALLAFPEGNPISKYSIPETVTSIENGAFGACNGLTELNLPASLTSIGEGAFWMCDNLKDVVFFGDTEPTLGEDAFFSSFSKIDLWLPNVASGFTATKWNAKEIHYGQVPVAVDLNTKSSLRIFGEQGAIRIHGGDGTHYRVITLQGAIVAKGRVSSANQIIPVGTSGIYLVEVDGRSEKVMVK